MKMGAQKYVRTCACAVAPHSTAPLDTAKNIWEPGGAHSVRVRCRWAAPVGCAAGRAGRVKWGTCSKNRKQGGGGGKCEAVHRGGVVQGRLRYLVRRLPSGRHGWHQRAANKRIEICARTADMSGMIMCMDGMQQTACHEHV